MPSKSVNAFCTLSLLLTSFIAGHCDSVIRANLHEDVLLPCQGVYNGKFTLEYLVITWQRSENDAVVHSFFHGRDQPGYQEEEYKGRTQLFPEEFHEGNASLLIKGVRVSDAGSYTCHYILYDRDDHTPQEVVLRVHEEETYGSDEGKRRNHYLLLLIIPVALVLAAVSYALIRKNRKRPTEEDAHDGHQATESQKREGVKTNFRQLSREENRAPAGGSRPRPRRGHRKRRS